MRYERARVARRPARLRIPMRGYEAVAATICTVIGMVTNPHAGL